MTALFGPSPDWVGVTGTRASGQGAYNRPGPQSQQQAKPLARQRQEFEWCLVQVIPRTFAEQRPPRGVLRWLDLHFVRLELLLVLPYQTQEMILSISFVVANRKTYFFAIQIYVYKRVY